MNWWFPTVSRTVCLIIQKFNRSAIQPWYQIFGYKYILIIHYWFIILIHYIFSLSWVNVCKAIAKARVKFRVVDTRPQLKRPIEFLDAFNLTNKSRLTSNRGQITHFDYIFDDVNIFWQSPESKTFKVSNLKI